MRSIEWNDLRVNISQSINQSNMVHKGRLNKNPILRIYAGLFGGGKHRGVVVVLLTDLFKFSITI